MDREALRNQAAGRRRYGEEETDLRRGAWFCGYCQHEFATEGGFMRHRCKGRLKLEELKSPTGQAAYLYYGEWMKLSKRSVPSIETFSTSRCYSSFIKFAEWASKTHLPSPTGFIRLMVESGVQPPLWCRDNAYALYLKNYDEVVPPDKQFIDSYDALLQLSDDHGVPVAAVFSVIGVDALLNLVQRRKLSPWFLVASETFREFKNSCSEVDKQRLEDGAQISAMVLRIKQSEKLIELFTEFRQAAKDLGV